jgi:hypothetical protein
MTTTRKLPSIPAHRLTRINADHYLVLALDEHGQAWNVGRIIRSSTEPRVWHPEPRNSEHYCRPSLRRVAVALVLAHGQATGR